MKTTFLIIYLSTISLFFSACSSTNTVQIHPPIKQPPNEKIVALFFDGTQNDRDSRTNISTLSDIVTNQNRDNLYVFYSEGVGSDGRFAGAGTGWGIGNDVAEAYAFLSEYYTSDSKLYVFGFSRGAFTSRILAGMIYSIGLYDLTSFQKDERIKIAKQLFDAYKGKGKDITSIKQQGNDIVNKWKSQSNAKLTSKLEPGYIPSIQVMGLWDTVEALGVVPTWEAIKEKVFGINDPQNIIDPNGRYIDQICNAEHIYHALSLDDNRANVFTPIIISSKHVVSTCKPEDSSISKVEEVWFSGAHSDVGGGYSINDNNNKGDNTDRDISLSGISLNWMMTKLKESAPELLPKDAEVFENHLAYLHDAENYSPMYKRVTRHNILTKYFEFSRYGKLKIHYSVFNRLALPANEREKLGYDSGWYKLDKFKECFDINEYRGYLFKGCPLIEAVK